MHNTLMQILLYDLLTKLDTFYYNIYQFIQTLHVQTTKIHPLPQIPAPTTRNSPKLFVICIVIQACFRGVTVNTI